MYDLAAQGCIPELFAISFPGPIVSYSLVTTCYWQMPVQQESDSDLLFSVHTLITPFSSPRGKLRA